MKICGEGGDNLGQQYVSPEDAIRLRGADIIIPSELVFFPGTCGLLLVLSLSQQTAQVFVYMGESSLTSYLLGTYGLIFHVRSFAVTESPYLDFAQVCANVP